MTQSHWGYSYCRNNSRFVAYYLGDFTYTLSKNSSFGNALTRVDGVGEGEHGFPVM